MENVLNYLRQNWKIVAGVAVALAFGWWWFKKKGGRRR